MKSITEIQPWGTCIIHHGKNIENRSWAPPYSLIGERIAIHAGKKLDKEALEDVCDLLGVSIKREDVPLGAIIGTVRLIGVVDTRRTMNSRGLSHMEIANALASDWRSYGSEYLWVLDSPLALAHPIPCKGSLGLWDVPAEIAARLDDASEVA